MKRLDTEPCGGDGYGGGDCNRILLLRALCQFLNDPIEAQRARAMFVAHAPPEDQGLFEEVMDDLAAGLEPDAHVLAAVVEHAGIFMGLTLRPGGAVENDTGFVWAEPWE